MNLTKFCQRTKTNRLNRFNRSNIFSLKTGYFCNVWHSRALTTEQPSPQYTGIVHTSQHAWGTCQAVMRHFSHLRGICACAGSVKEVHFVTEVMAFWPARTPRTQAKYNAHHQLLDHMSCSCPHDYKNDTQAWQSREVVSLMDVVVMQQDINNLPFRENMVKPLYGKTMQSWEILKCYV